MRLLLGRTTRAYAVVLAGSEEGTPVGLANIEPSYAAAQAMADAFSGQFDADYEVRSVDVRVGLSDRPL